MKIKLITTFFLIAILGALLSLAGSTRQADEPGVLLRAAVEKEEVEGDLQGAIDMYKQIIAKHSGDYAIAAKAQLRIGFCYEKLGMQEARNAFQKVIENYPQQYEEVKAAKERISQLAKTLATIPGKPKFRKIQIPANPGNGVLSADGKRLAFASEGSIWVVPIPGKVDPNMAGTPVRLTEPMAAENSSNTLAWSGDGKWIAFNTFTISQNSICVVPSSGGEVIKVPVETTGNVFRRRLSLSPDGKILAFCNVFGDSVGIFSVSVGGGKAQRLTDSPSLGNLRPVFSPDGKRLAYVEVFRSENGLTSSIWVIGSRGGTPVKIGDYTGTIRGPVWSPDSKMISFILDPRNPKSTRNKEICFVPAKPAGPESIKPIRIELPLQKSSYHHPAGWTTQNSIGLHLGNPSEDAIYTVPSLGGRATQISPTCAANHPRWSPDGKRIFFRRGMGISSIPSDGGPVTTLIPHIPNSDQVWEATAGGGNNVSSDGKKLVFSGVKSVGKRGEKDFHIELRIFTLPVEGGQPTQITNFPWDPDIKSQDRFPCWSPDGKWIAFTRDMENEKKDWWGYNIFIVPSGGGEPRQITSESHRVSYAGIDWSPDGKHIAYFTQDNTIDLIPEEGGPSKTLVKVDDVDSHWELSWSPDGRKIAYSCKGRIYTVPVEGGQPVEVKTGLDAEANNLSWSADGKTIAFAATKSDPAELYLMEDFLHLLKGRK
jgi:Tol biopolymer transport system component